MPEENEVSPVENQAAAVRFCPICGHTMDQGMRYGFLCWICPECDYDEPV